MNAKRHCVNCEHENDYNYCVSCVLVNSNSFFPSNYKEREKEAVNHPTHYKTGNYECIEVMADIFGIEDTQTFCYMNAFKYLWRCKHKGNRVKDVEKAHWYLKKFIELEMVKNGKS